MLPADRVWGFEFDHGATDALIGCFFGKRVPHVRASTVPKLVPVLSIR